MYRIIGIGLTGHRYEVIGPTASKTLILLHCNSDDECFGGMATTEFINAGMTNTGLNIHIIFAAGQLLQTSKVFA